MASKWKAYQVWKPWLQGGCVYMVGRVKVETRPLEDSNIEWNGFYSKSCAEAMEFADGLNKKEARTDE